MIGQTGFCEICNKQVEIINVIPHSKYDQLIFSCGDSSKLVKRSVEEAVSIEDKIWTSKCIKVEPLSRGGIPVVISGDRGIKARGFLVPAFKIHMENGNCIISKLLIYDLSSYNDTTTPNPTEPDGLQDILIQVKNSGHSPSEKANITKILNQVDRQLKSKPLPHIISSLGTLQTYLFIASPYIQLLVNTVIKRNTS
jgi:hypothetical protein